MIAAGQKAFAKNLEPGRTIPIPKHAGTVQARGVYRLGPRCEPVEIELADLADDPLPDFEASSSMLTDLLRSLANGTDDVPDEQDPASDNGSTSLRATDRALPTDARFPFGFLMDAEGRDRKAARRWLDRVAKLAGKGDVPGFWGVIARYLL
jgi:hypothetical protein